MGRGNLLEVQGGSRDPFGNPRRVGRPSEGSSTGLGTLWKSRTGRGTPGEICDGSVDPQGGPDRVGGPTRRVGSGRGTLRKIRDGSGELPEDLRWVEGLSRRSRTDWEVLRKVRNGWGYPQGVLERVG